MSGGTPLTAAELPEARRIYRAVQKEIATLQRLNVQLYRRIKQGSQTLTLNKEVSSERIITADLTPPHGASN
jgi:hypothetical protein